MASSESTDGRPTDRTDNELLESAYDLLSRSFEYPESMSGASFKRETSTLLPELARRIDRTAADQFAQFLAEYDDISTAEYIATLELEPDCPLYLGHYVFDQPATCHDIADADRNQYMVELAGIYEHYGLALQDELPDFIPAMAEFLSMTADRRGDELRREFLERFVEFLPQMVEHFEEHGTPYQYPVSAVYRIATIDLEDTTTDHGTENGGDR